MTSDIYILLFFFFSSRRRHTRFDCDWSSDVCSSDLTLLTQSRIGLLQEVDFAVLFGHDYVVSKRGLSTGFQQNDVPKRNLDAQPLRNVEKCARGEECVVESCELVVSGGYCLREPVSGEVWKLDQGRFHV